MNIYKLYILLFSIVCLVNACATNDYRVVEIELNRLDRLEDSSWLRIDDLTFIHTPHDFEWKSDVIIDSEDGAYTYVPSSIVYFYHPQNSEKRVQEQMTHFEITKNISDRLGKYKEGGVTYQIVNPSMLLAGGKLVLRRSDNHKIRIKSSENYPVYLKQYQIPVD